MPSELANEIQYLDRTAKEMVLADTCLFDEGNPLRGNHLLRRMLHNNEPSVAAAQVLYQFIANARDIFNSLRKRLLSEGCKPFLIANLGQDEANEYMKQHPIVDCFDPTVGEEGY